MRNLDVDKAVDYVTKLIDNIRCATCAKLDGCRLRYPCGHTACEDCVVYIEECPTCTSPVSGTPPITDYPMTHNVQHVTILHNASRKLFDPDAFQHKRISEKLKIEKDFFPNCIQAPIKYENKRKSLRFSLNKENRYSSFISGEAIPYRNNTMENSATYVQQWLNKNERNLSRKPFAELNVNTDKISITKRKSEIQYVEKNNAAMGTNRKRAHVYTTDNYYSKIANKKESVYEVLVAPKKVKKLDSRIINKCENDESGIFMDNEPIVIDDSQERLIDKDKEAWLAVLAAHKKEYLESTSLLDSSQYIVDSPNQMTNFATNDITIGNFRKVPFIKKSAITETCKHCNYEMNSAKSVLVTSNLSSVPMINEYKPVKITIDTDSFFTTVTVIKDVRSKEQKHRSSVLVQTATSQTIPLKNNIFKETVDSTVFHKNKSDIVLLNVCNTTNTRLRECHTQSKDLFADDKNIIGEVVGKAENKCIVIEESDSDTDLEASGPMSVQAEVHRSCEEIEYGVLTEVMDVKEHECKDRPKPRGSTPTSTDSSEKENYNPNRMKMNAPGKKKVGKK